MKVQGFIGPSNVATSLNVDAEECVNLIVEVSDAGTPKVPRASYLRPGLEPFVRLASAPVRGLFYQDGRGFAVSGNAFYELFQSQTAIERGTVAVDQNPVTIDSNGPDDGHQLFIVSGGLGYIYDLNADTLTQITDPDFPTNALMGGFLNSRFFVLKAQSNQFYWSALLDGEDWNSLDTARVSQTSDQIRCMLMLHGVIWLLGSQNTAAWWNSAFGNTTFQPIESAKMKMGTAASFSPVEVDNTVYWLGENKDGSRVIYKANGYEPVIISTRAIEQYLTDLSRVDDAIGWTCQMRGHAFYVLYLPVADHSLVYDVSSQTWTKWAVWNPTLCEWFPHLGRCHTYGFGQHLVGDRQSGTIYSQSFDLLDDNFILAAGL